MSRIGNLLLLALLAFPLAADDESRFQLQYAKNFRLNGGRVTIDHSFGALTLRTHDGPEVQVRATIRSSDEAFGRNIRILAEERDGGVTVRTQYPDGSRRGRLSYSVDMTVLMPRSAVVHASNRFGSIDARGLGAASVLSNRQGSITLLDARGNQQLTNAFGSIHVRNLTGDLTATNQNGSVNVGAVSGTITVANRFGSVNVTDAARSATITNANGSIEARDVRGALTATNAFGSVEASTIGGAATITTSNASVDVTGIGANATITNSFGSVNARDVKGSLVVESANSQLEARAIGGNVKIESSFGPVFVDGVGGAIDITNANGAIAVEGLRGGRCQPVSLKTNFSAIRVAVPASAGYAVNARTSFGRIHSELPITTNGVTETMVKGTIGRGGCAMNLVNANGNITIERD